MNKRSSNLFLMLVGRDCEKVHINVLNYRFLNWNLKIRCPDHMQSLSELPSPPRPEVRRPAQGWGSLWESSSFAPWFILNTFRDVSGVVPEWPWSSGFMRKSSSLANAPSIRFSVLQILATTFWWLFPQFPRKLELYSPPVIWEHLSFVPIYPWDVPHSFL